MREICPLRRLLYCHKCKHTWLSLRLIRWWLTLILISCSRYGQQIHRSIIFILICLCLTMPSVLYIFALIGWSHAHQHPIWRRVSISSTRGRRSNHIEIHLFKWYLMFAIITIEVIYYWYLCGLASQSVTAFADFVNLVIIRVRCFGHEVHASKYPETHTLPWILSVHTVYIFLCCRGCWYSFISLGWGWTRATKPTHETKSWWQPWTWCRLIGWFDLYRTLVVACRAGLRGRSILRRCQTWKHT